MFPVFRSQSVYNLVYPFPSTAASASIAAAGGAGNTQVRRMFPDKYFIGSTITGAVYNQAVSGTSIAGTPLTDIPDPSPPAAVGNTWFASTLVLVQFQINQAFDCDTPYPWSTKIGTGRQPHVLAIPLVVRPNSDTMWNLVNNSAVAIAGSITIEGMLVDKNEYEAWVSRTVGK